MDAIDVYQRLSEGDHVRITIVQEYENDTLHGEVESVEIGGDYGATQSITVELDSPYRKYSDRHYVVDLETTDEGKPPLKCVSDGLYFGPVHSIGSEDVADGANIVDDGS